MGADDGCQRSDMPQRREIVKTYTDEMRIAEPVSSRAAARTKFHSVVQMAKRTRMRRNLKKCAASWARPTIQLRRRKVSRLTLGEN